MDRKNINSGFKKLRVWPPALRAYAPEGKMPFAFMFWPIEYFLNSHSSSKKLPQTASILLIAFQEIFQKLCVFDHYSMDLPAPEADIPSFHVGGIKPVLLKAA
jgi:hypothetical protein